MVWKAIGVCLLFILVASILINLWEWVGIWLIVVPVVAVGTPVSVVFTRKGIQARAQHKIEAAHKLKVDTARAEAKLGIPVAMDGRCATCHAPLVAGATFCTHCGTQVPDATGKGELPLVLCQQCSERQPADAQYCWQCGAALVGVPSAQGQARARTQEEADARHAREAHTHAQAAKASHTITRRLKVERLADGQSFRILVPMASPGEELVGVPCPRCRLPIPAGRDRCVQCGAHIQWQDVARVTA